MGSSTASPTFGFSGKVLPLSCRSYLTTVKGRMFVADGGKSVETLLAPTDEPFRPEMVQYKEATELGVHAMWQLQTDRSELQRQYLDQWAAQEGLDAILGESSQPVAHIGANGPSANNPLLERPAWWLQVCRIHRRLQRGRLCSRLFPLRRDCR